MEHSNKVHVTSSHAEILLRGEVIKLFAEVEKILAIIVLFCQNDVVAETQKDEAIKLKGMMLAQKIERASEMLEKYHAKVWEKNKQLFEDLVCLKNFRNRIAHCSITWDDNDTSHFIVWDIDTAEDNIQYYKAFKYSIVECQRLLDEIESALKRLKELLPYVIVKYPELTILVLSGKGNK